MKYCPNCKQNVEPKKKFSIICCVLTAGFIYIPYYLFFKKKSCPICGNKHLEKEHDMNQCDLLNGVGLPQPTVKQIYQEKLDKAIEKDKEATAKYNDAKNATAETIRKRQAGELPWQIKKAEKKAAKEARKLAKAK